MVSSFIQAPQDYFDAEPTFKQSYAPQSGEIFGILKQMKETFETNLSSSHKEEMSNQKAYEELKAAKEDEIKAGQAQMEAVSKALAVLSSDDAHDLFTKTFNPSFVQTEARSERRSKAAAVLSSVAKKLNSPRLSAIAAKVRLDAFTKVKKAIDDMVAQLLEEKADEIKHKDFCVEEFNTNQLQTEKKD